MFSFLFSTTLNYFLWKFDIKTQNCQFKLKYNMQANSNMQNSVAMFTFSFFQPEILCLGKFFPVNWNCQYKLEFGI